MTDNIALQITVDANNELPTEHDFKTWAKLANTHSHDCEICFRIVSKEEIQCLNKQYRNKDKPTNVLSFPVGLEQDYQHPHDEPLYLGDIIFCHDVIAEEAHEQQKKLLHHYAHMTIHGILHLLGYDHQDDSDAEIMETREIQLLKELGISNPYQEHSA